MSKPGQGILITALIVLLGLLAVLVFFGAKQIASSPLESSDLRLLILAFVVLGVLIVGVLRALWD